MWYMKVVGAVSRSWGVDAKRELEEIIRRNCLAAGFVYPVRPESHWCPPHVAAAADAARPAVSQALVVGCVCGVGFVGPPRCEPGVGCRLWLLV